MRQTDYQAGGVNITTQGDTLLLFLKSVGQVTLRFPIHPSGTRPPVRQNHPQACECAARTSFISLKASYCRVRMSVN